VGQPLSRRRLAPELAVFALRAKLRLSRRKGKFGQTGDGIKAAKTVHASAISPRGAIPLANFTSPHNDTAA